MLIQYIQKYENFQYERVEIFGSLLFPSRQFISRFRFRPWKGVYISDKFLDSICYAEQIIIKILSLYNYYKITPVVETMISSERDLINLKKYLI